jgi:predicted TIM-barrel fold metal-dependent hydrolase
VLFPTSGLAVGNVRDPDLATALAHAYNDWLADFCAAAPERLKGVGIVALQEPAEATKELERLAGQGHVAVQVTTYVAWRKLSDRALDPFYAAAERLRLPLAIHSQPRDAAGTDRFDKFLAIHAVAHPFEQMIAMAQLILGGVFERYPALRVGFLESGAGWVPFWMEHLEGEWEKRPWDAPLCKSEPKDYMTCGRAYYACEPEEKTIPYVAQWVGEDQLLYASDYPHWDTEWPHTVSTLLDRDDMTPTLKRKILSENALRFYGIKAAVPAG